MAVVGSLESHAILQGPHEIDRTKFNTHPITESADSYSQHFPENINPYEIEQQSE